MVGLDRTFYQVLEDVGVVEVCAIVHSPNITCPIEYTFHINLSTSNGSAGIYTSLTTMCIGMKTLFHILFCEEACSVVVHIQ